MRVALLFLSLLASGGFLAACTSSGGGAGGVTKSNFYYAPPMNYNPKAGLNPNLSEGFNTQSPSSPPFKP